MIDRLKVFPIFLFIIFLNISCDKNIQENIKNSSFLPRASGENNEMLIIMDSAKFKGKIGRLSSDFRAKNQHLAFWSSKSPEKGGKVMFL